ncbi:hypothetical protein N7466_001119 [Penicillium verhagenii]|uniref:uncharacterized protein n=1 Tax=Penicillium verhagenii TaxID=1562060 RepID=UPI00254542A8|nr:uncharacterized protein N7466_001119 [Penicillium verhagenii]KAJ5948104.1 hypothetical protein N7466_001119 [Penicillium verhagenii]
MTLESIFEPLQSIGDHIYLYEFQGNNVPDSSSPSLVILCTWVGGATPRRINKYLSQYREIYPYTSILLITTSFPTILLQPFSWTRASLKPARLAIRRIAQKIGAEPRHLNGQHGILLHLFSHGGGNIAVQLALSLKEEKDQGSPFFSNLNSIILDCCPGDDGLGRAYAAARTSVPDTSVARLLGNTLLYPTVAVINGLQHVRLMRSIQDLRHLLNDPTTFGPTPKRLYIYSTKDAMVKWEDVESHIQDARAQGYLVGQVRFDNSSHCGLIMEDPDRYWTAIQKFWRGEDVSHLSSTGNDKDLRSRL